MPEPRRAPLWLLRVLAACLALLFALPACFTMIVWADDRSSETVHRATAPELQVWIAPESPGAVVMHVAPALAAKLRALLPEATSEWLLVTPREVPSTVFAVLGMQCASAGHDRHGIHGLWAGWWVVEEADEPAPVLTLQCFAASSIGVVPHLPGFRKSPGLIPSYTLEVQCSVQALPGRPASLGTAVPNPVLGHERKRDDGMPLSSRLLLTPLALLGDLLLLPFELFWWFTP